MSLEEPRVLVVAVATLSYALLSRSLGPRWVSMPAAMLALGYLVGAVIRRLHQWPCISLIPSEEYLAFAEAMAWSVPETRLRKRQRRRR